MEKRVRKRWSEEEGEEGKLCGGKNGSEGEVKATSWQSSQGRKKERRRKKRENKKNGEKRVQVKGRRRRHGGASCGCRR